MSHAHATTAAPNTAVPHARAAYLNALYAIPHPPFSCISPCPFLTRALNLCSPLNLCFSVRQAISLFYIHPYHALYTHTTPSSSSSSSSFPTPFRLLRSLFCNHHPNHCNSLPLSPPTHQPFHSSSTLTITVHRPLLPTHTLTHPSTSPKNVHCLHLSSPIHPLIHPPSQTPFTVLILSLLIHPSQHPSPKPPSTVVSTHPHIHSPSYSSSSQHLYPKHCNCPPSPLFASPHPQPFIFLLNCFPS